jgi:hypothetical protein
MKRKLLVIIAGYFFFLIAGLISCEEINECGPFPDRFKVTSLDWINYRAVYSDTAAIPLFLSEISNDTVGYNEYSIFIAPRTETYYSMIQKSNSFGLISSAYACSPVIPTTDERIDSIVIICNRNFDSHHPAGHDLSGLFDMVVYDQVNNIYYDKYDLTEYIETKPSVPDEMTCILKSPPDQTTDFEFTVKYFQDGIDFDYFGFRTNKIVIKR